jgi:hypothetical protein
MDADVRVAIVNAFSNDESIVVPKYATLKILDIIIGTTDIIGH